ncbi:TetR/AcrR family transcriptional regulator [Microbispora sp. ATCC PTA-5024]|uniref:TetR/AcrR family transcriptional regulator n=1 Tax=Microbispora sp. ATCC PTA-5024 TaxID=316330 RepID=UPI0003FD16D8|nr:TetR/AcrR family transcriptional regulator [Microbispora sp. ATCC PTA-5024]
MSEAMRADARRNYDMLLGVARQAFAEQGTDASLRDVARRAGVGIGTLYRHFPTREALLEALLRSGFDGLRAKADDLLESPSPKNALAEWLLAFALGSGTYRGLPESVMGALADDTSRLHSSCEAMRHAGGRLLARAQETGAVRDDLTTGEMLSLAAGVSWAAGQSRARTEDREAFVARLLEVTMEGLAPSGG